MTAHRYRESFLVAFAFAVLATQAPVRTQQSSERVITGQPYSADSVVTITLTALGAPVEQRVIARMYRDSAGRIRREQAPGAQHVPGPGDREDLVVVIVDPVAGVVYSLNPATRTAYRIPAGQSPNAVSTIPQSASAFTESLGSSIIEGLTVTGRRGATTLPAGTDGRPVEIVDERWESSELGVALLERHRDSRSGVFEHRLTNLRRSEPPAALFVIPANYSVVDAVVAARR